MQGINLTAESKAMLISDSSEFRSAFERRRHQKPAGRQTKAGYQLEAGGYGQANGEGELSASVNREINPQTACSGTCWSLHPSKPFIHLDVSQQDLL